jgi:hypothetical protein
MRCGDSAAGTGGAAPSRLAAGRGGAARPETRVARVPARLVAAAGVAGLRDPTARADDVVVFAAEREDDVAVFAAGATTGRRRAGVLAAGLAAGRRAAAAVRAAFAGLSAVPGFFFSGLRVARAVPDCDVFPVLFPGVRAIREV